MTKQQWVFWGVSPHLSPGFHPKVGQSQNCVTGMDSENPRKNTLSLAREPERRGHLHAGECAEISPFFPSLFFSLMAFLETRPILMLPALGPAWAPPSEFPGCPIKLISSDLQALMPEFLLELTNNFPSAIFFDIRSNYFDLHLKAYWPTFDLNFQGQPVTPEI